MYSKINWRDRPSVATPVNADNLNKMDKGIADAHEELVIVASQLQQIAEETVKKSEITNDRHPLDVSGWTYLYADLPTANESNKSGYLYCKDGDGINGAGNYVSSGTSWYFGGTGDEGYPILSARIETRLDTKKSMPISKVGTLINANTGAEITDNRYSITDKEYVQPGDIVSVSNINASTSVALVALYDSDGHFISTIVRGEGYATRINVSVTITSFGYIKGTYHYPEDPTEGHISVSRYTDLSKNINIVNKKIDTLAGSESHLHGKIINFLGDSYVANNNWHKVTGDGIDPFSYTWCKMIADRYDMIANNYGINGNGMVAERTGVPMNLRYTDMGEADYIVVVGGRNDYNAQIPIVDFVNGLKILCKGLIVKYPRGKICFFTPWCINEENSTKTVKQEDIANAIVETCGKYSIPVFDSYHNGSMYMGDIPFRRIHSQGESDESHLNDVGHLRFMNPAEKFILSL